MNLNEASSQETLYVVFFWKDVLTNKVKLLLYHSKIKSVVMMMIIMKFWGLEILDWELELRLGIWIGD